MTARLFDGHSAQVREVSVNSDAHGWHIMGDGIHLVWPIATIALDHVGPTHWRLHGPAGAVLELPVGPQADALMAPLRRPARPMSLRHWVLLLTSAWLVGGRSVCGHAQRCQLACQAHSHVLGTGMGRAGHPLFFRSHL